jgi:hypothetical protein
MKTDPQMLYIFKIFGGSKNVLPYTLLNKGNFKLDCLCAGKSFVHCGSNWRQMNEQWEVWWCDFHKFPRTHDIYVLQLYF